MTKNNHSSVVPSCDRTCSSNPVKVIIRSGFSNFQHRNGKSPAEKYQERPQMEEGEPSYIDYETFLDPSFSPQSFANTLVLATNNASDSPLDLSTPLSRVLFDVQEVDTHIDNLSKNSAIPLLKYTKESVGAGERILQEVETQLATLTESYDRLQKEVTVRYAAAEEVRLVAERLWQTLKLGRSIGRCLTLGRQLEAHMSDLKGSISGKKGDDRAMVRGANTLLSFRHILPADHSGSEGKELERIIVVRTLRAELIEPAEKTILQRAEQIVSQFSMSSLTASTTESTATANMQSVSTYAQLEDTRLRATSALISLYLLSPVQDTKPSKVFEPSYLISALQEYLRRAITSSLAGLTGALATIPKLDRTLLEVAARCQNIVALEMLLESIKPPPHPLLSGFEVSPNIGSDNSQQTKLPLNLLQPLLDSLDTSSLPSYFWRSMASQLSSRVQRIMKDGGVSARTLRSNKERVREAIRDCVDRGSQLPASSLSKGKGTSTRNWEREAAVMVGAVVNVLGR